MAHDKNLTDTLGNPIFKAVLDNATDALLISDDQGYLLAYNQTAGVMFGYSKDELDKMGMHHLLQYHSKKQFAVLWKQFLESPVHNGILDLQHRDGSIVKVNLKVKPAVLPGVNLFIITDITKQVKQQKLLAASERRFKALVREGADLISIVDEAGNYRSLSENFWHILGSDPLEFIGESTFDLIHPEDRSAVIVLFSKLKELKQIKTEPFRFKDQSGNWRWLTMIATNLLHDPSVGGIVCNYCDSTEATVKSKQLNHIHERYKLLMNAAREAIFDWDIIADNIDWGSGFLDNFGYNFTENNSYHFYNNIYRKDKNRVWAEIEEGMSDPDKERIVSEFCFHNYNQDVVKVRLLIIFLRDQLDMVYRAVGSLKNITSHDSQLHRVIEHNIGEILTEHNK